MSYISLNTDFAPIIQLSNLSQITGGDNSILNYCINIAQAEAVSYLKQSYDLSREIRDLNLWSATKTYNARDIVYDGSNNIFYAVYPYPYFDVNAPYNKGDKVFFNNTIYTALLPTGYLTDSEIIQYIYTENIPYANAIPGYQYQYYNQWDTGVPYLISAGTPLSNSAWLQSDPRDAQLVNSIVDISLFHLHSRVSPRVIPELRTIRYTDAKTWLSNIASGVVTPAIPPLQSKNSQFIKYSSDTPTINIW